MKKNMVIKTLLGGLFGAVSGVVVSQVYMNKKVTAKDKKIGKFKTYYSVLNQWIVSLHEKKCIDTYFIDNGYKTVAIYGMGELGNRLYEELKDSEIEVKYAIDKDAAYTYADLEIKDLEDDLETVDVVVVTAIFAFDEIEEELRGRISSPIVSLEDVVYEI